MLTSQDFGDGYRDPISKSLSIAPALLGIINASYSLGAICAVPFAPMFNQYVGRRWAIMCGSITMVIGAILQGFAQHGERLRIFPSPALTDYSGNVYYCTDATWVGN